MSKEGGRRKREESDGFEVAVGLGLAVSTEGRITQNISAAPLTRIAFYKFGCRWAGRAEMVGGYGRL